MAGPVGRYSSEQIYTAVEVKEITDSKTYAAKMTGIPGSTIYDWAEKEKEGELDEFVLERASDREELKKEMEGNGGEEKVSSPEEELKRFRLEKRLQYLELAWEVVSLGLEQLKKVLPESKSVKDIATTLGIITDKILLMQGEANRRTETTSNLKRDDLLDVAKQAGIEAAKVVQQDEITPKRKQKRNTAKEKRAEAV